MLDSDVIEQSVEKIQKAINEVYKFRRFNVSEDWYKGRIGQIYSECDKVLTHTGKANFQYAAQLVTEAIFEIHEICMVPSMTDLTHYPVFNRNKPKLINALNDFYVKLENANPYFHFDDGVCGYTKKLIDKKEPAKYTKDVISFFANSRQDLIQDPQPVPKMETPLFKHEGDADRYLEALKIIKPAILNAKGEYIRGEKSKSKGSVVAWLDLLDQRSLLNPHNSETRALLTNELIPCLNISGRSLQNLGRAYHECYSDLSALIDKI